MSSFKVAPSLRVSRPSILAALLPSWAPEAGVLGLARISHEEGVNATAGQNGWNRCLTEPPNADERYTNPDTLKVLWELSKIKGRRRPQGISSGVAVGLEQTRPAEENHWPSRSILAHAQPNLGADLQQP